MLNIADRDEVSNIHNTNNDELNHANDNLYLTQKINLQLMT